MLARRRERVLQARRVAAIGALQRHRDERTRLEIHGVLRLVREMRPAIFHLRDARVRIRRACPLLVRALLLPLAIEPRQGFARRRLDPRRLRQLREERDVAFARVPSHDAAHGRICFERRRVDADGLAAQQLGLDQPRLHPREDRPMRLDVDQTTGPRDRRMVRGRVFQAQPQEGAHGQRVGGPPRNAALRIEAFKIADQQETEIPSGRQAGTAHHRGIEAAALRLGKPVELRRVQDLIQPRIERMSGRARQVRRRDPQWRLLGFSCTHRHTCECSEADPFWRSIENSDGRRRGNVQPRAAALAARPTFTTGC